VGERLVDLRQEVVLLVVSQVQRARHLAGVTEPVLLVGEGADEIQDAVPVERLLGHLSVGREPVLVRVELLEHLHDLLGTQVSH